MEFCRLLAAQNLKNLAETFGRISKANPPLSTYHRIDLFDGYHCTCINLIAFLEKPKWQTYVEVQVWRDRTTDLLDIAQSLRLKHPLKNTHPESQWTYWIDQINHLESLISYLSQQTQIRLLKLIQSHA